MFDTSANVVCAQLTFSSSSKYSWDPFREELSTTATVAKK